MSITIPYSPIDGEIWRPIPGYDECYQVSTEGRFRRIKGRGASIERPRLLRPSPDTAGYLRAQIMVNGERVAIGVHQLVALVFIGPCPEGLEVDHIDLDKTNNRPGNLEYVTHAENLRRARAHKSWSASGERSGTAKLTEAQVRAIRRDPRPQRVVAADHGVSQVAVHNVRAHKTWREVED